MFLRLRYKNPLIWGSGIGNIGQPVANAHSFYAVRGPLTRRRLIELGYKCPTVYGDPALCCQNIFNLRLRSNTLGIIPHLVDYDSIAHMYADDDETLIIDVRTADIEKIVKQILSCECTVSSSLHGIVLSVTYGRWMKYSDKIIGDDTKFYDFFASLEPEIEFVLDYKRVCIPREDDHYDRYRPLVINDKKIDIESLVAATYPFELTKGYSDILG